MSPVSEAVPGGRPRRILMITQDVEVTPRILREAHALIDAGHSVRILTRSGDAADRTGTVEGIPVEWVAVQGRDPRFAWLYRLIGRRRGTAAAALWSVLTGRHTFTLRALPRALAAEVDVYHAHDLNNLLAAFVATAQAGYADAQEHAGDPSADFTAIIEEAERGAALAILSSLRAPRSEGRTPCRTR